MVVAENRVQESLNAVHEWCRTWQVNMNPKKSQVVLFSKCKKETHDKEIINFKLVDKKIPVENEAIYLGITFDSRLSWEQQVTKMANKAYGRLNLLRAMVGLSSKSNPNLLSQLYSSTIRSIFEYASLCVVCTADMHMKKLELIQNQALRIILKVPAYIPIEVMKDGAGQDSIKAHLIKFARNRVKQLSQSSPLARKTIENFKQIRHSQYNFSTLDALQLND